MTADPLSAPDLAAITAAFLAAGADFVVIGGFAVIANRHIRTTRDVDLLIPDDETNDAAILDALHDLGARRERDGVPVTFELLAENPHLRASTGSGIVDLEAIHGELPIDPIPGLDS